MKQICLLAAFFYQQPPGTYLGTMKGQFNFGNEPLSSTLAASEWALGFWVHELPQLAPGHPLYPCDADGYACFGGWGGETEWQQERKSDQGFILMISNLILNFKFMFPTSGVSFSSNDAYLHIKSSPLRCFKVFCLQNCYGPFIQKLKDMLLFASNPDLISFGWVCSVFDNMRQERQLGWKKLGIYKKKIYFKIC